MDTIRDREIECGRSYKFEPLGVGECNIQEKFKSLMFIEEGDIVYFRFSAFTLRSQMTALINKYN